MRLIPILILLALSGRNGSDLNAQEPRTRPGDKTDATDAKAVVVYVQPPAPPVPSDKAPVMVEPVDHAMRFLLSFAAALPALLAAIAAFIQSMRNGATQDTQQKQIDAIHKVVVGNVDPASLHRQANT